LSTLQEASQCALLLLFMVDVLSMKEHPRRVILTYLPKEVDILYSHPMFRPDGDQHGIGLNFAYE
jgi:prephenate dehydrogenase